MADVAYRAPDVACPVCGQRTRSDVVVMAKPLSREAWGSAEKVDVVYTCHLCGRLFVVAWPKHDLDETIP